MAFIQTNFDLDVPIKGTVVNNEEFKEFIIRTQIALQTIATAVNRKNSGEYALASVSTDQIWFGNPALNTARMPRNTQRRIVLTGQLPNAGTISIPHNIPINATVQQNLTATFIWGAATDLVAPLYIPLPFATPNALNQNIQVTIDNTNVNITTGTNRTNFTVSYVGFEYLLS